MNSQKCDKCVNGRVVISENGPHTKCTLFHKKATKCLLGQESHFRQIPQVKNSEYLVDEVTLKFDDDFEILIISAIRYAIGRQTYVPHSVIRFTNQFIGFLSSKTLFVIERDIAEAKFYGDPKIDEPEWMSFLVRIKEELKKRKVDN